jgi:hypothetical protein
VNSIKRPVLLAYAAYIFDMYQHVHIMNPFETVLDHTSLYPSYINESSHQPRPQASLAVPVIHGLTMM